MILKLVNDKWMPLEEQCIWIAGEKYSVYSAKRAEETENLRTKDFPRLARMDAFKGEPG